MQDNNNNYLTNMFKIKILKMLNLQDELNKKIDKNWLTKPEHDFHWRCDAMVEIGELLASTGYKHWKLDKLDIKNVKMEVIDVFHFLISQVLYNSNNNKIHIDDVADVLSNIFRKNLIQSELNKYDEKYENYFINNFKFNPDKNLGDEKYFRNKLIDLCEEFIIKNRKGKDAFASSNALVKIIALTFETFDEFYNLYLVKNALNIVRQKKGYKEGTYIKLWDKTREDNEIAIEYINENPQLTELDMDVLVEKLIDLYERYENELSQK